MEEYKKYTCGVGHPVKRDAKGLLPHCNKSKNTRNGLDLHTNNNSFMKLFNFLKLINIHGKF